jgi:hypothetical protein
MGSLMTAIDSHRFDCASVTNDLAESLAAKLFAQPTLIAFEADIFGGER